MKKLITWLKVVRYTFCWLLGSFAAEWQYQLDRYHLGGLSGTMYFAQADANRVAMRFSPETLWGETPATPTMTLMRLTGETLSVNKKTTESAEIRSDRQLPDVIQSQQMIEGGINVELSYSTFDKFWEALLASSFTAITISATITGTVAAGAKTITRSAGSFITDGVVAGMYLRFSGFTTPANNTIFRVLSLSATVLTVEDPDAVLVNETSGANAVGYKANMVRNGTTAKSLLLEQQFADITQFIYYNGMRANTAQLTFNAGAVITGAFTFMGKTAVASGVTVAGSTTPATTTDVLACGKNVGSIRKNGVPLTTGIKDISLSINGNLRGLDAVNNLNFIQVGFGRFNITGKLTAYFEDLTLYNHFINHDTVQLSWRVTDAANNAFIVTLDAVKFTKGDPSATAINTDVTIPLEWTAKVATTFPFMIQIDSIPA